ncbi:MAG: NAD-dependent protein deacylase [Candidatus Abyssobacteria bacterium SURF_17]|jgi:NAD-dependent deacetylase|uniref:protein acetyllysine N-acetyltransferase n=1 Tax=Candidatus Abyssobacteria bacterium SURF_17 TaxID=2093361 RepID=A0A419F9L4_9BACT|nr:MAG: NAD-dependent protein deacylase [Candidatus Abyssubacteria bacterium SURF_17]
MDSDAQKTLAEVAEIVAQRGHIVAFSGAGVSKESGIPTFREPGGLWDRFEPGASSGIMGVISAFPERAPEILEELLATFRKAKPNPGHLALAELERMGLLHSVVTQNIDNLHREAGNTIVYELHGSMYRLRCLGCGRKVLREREVFLEEFSRLIAAMKKQGIQNIFSLMARCECGGLFRPDFVAFGEAVQDLHESVDAVRKCRVMLVLGTSGVVYPAASLPGYARDAGAVIIEINPNRSALTRLAHHFLQGPTGVVLPRLTEEIRQRLQ